ncbi:MAG: DMT family transporter [Pikeienuella sp.]
MTEAAKGHFAMALFAALIAGSFALGGMAANLIDPGALTAARFVIAAALMAGIALAGPGISRAHLTTSTWRYLVMGGLLSAYFVLMFEALKVAEPVSTGAVFTLTPLLASGFGWLFLRQITTKFNIAAMLIGACGAVWVIFRGDVDAILGFRVGLGERIFFLGVVAHAAYAPLVRLFNRGEPVLTFTTGTLLAGATITTLWAARDLAATEWTTLPLIVWITLAYLAVATTAGTFFLLQFSALRLPAGKVMAYGYLTPTFVILWQAALGQGWVAPTVWVGAALTCVSLGLLAWR